MTMTADLMRAATAPPAIRKRALISGITGQDGAYLSKLLLEKGYEVYGTYRRLSSPNFWRMQYLGILDRVKLIPADLMDGYSLIEAVRIANPDEVYHLAAQSFVGASFEQPIGAGEITGLGTTRLLEAIRIVKSDVRFYNAATSEMFGYSNEPLMGEDTELAPASPYAVSKVYGYLTTKMYRGAYNMFACNGILFNHESELRGLEFVTRKITNSVAKIKAKIDTGLELGNMQAKRDWGYAPEYVEAMWLMLQQANADDYVVATGETHSVEEFVKEAFAVAGLEWEKYVRTTEALQRPQDVRYLCGDCSKARWKLKWEPRTKFKELVKLMVEEDMKRWYKWLRGEPFPWDAFNYPGEGNIISRMGNRGG